MEPVAVKREDLQEAGDDNEHSDISPNSSQNEDDGGSLGNRKATAPLQKRRRVTRACDECRRKKIKCDGKQPCTHCTIYSYDCTYDQPSNRRRNPVPAYVEALEARVQRAERLIRVIAPNLDLSDPALDIAVQHGFIPELKPNTGDARPTAHIPIGDSQMDRQANNDNNTIKEADIESMIRAVGQIELDENGHWDYHGHSSGLSFIRRMREQLGDLLGPETGATPFIKSRLNAGVVDSPKSTGIGSPMEALGPTAELPPEPAARKMCEYAYDRFSVLLRVVHGPTFWRQFQRVYTVSPNTLATEDLRFLPVLYSALALGTVSEADPSTDYAGSIDKGYKFFRMARQMMDIADIRDLPGLQAVLLMIAFLQSSANLSQCYSYVGLAARAAVRLGLHRSLPASRFSLLESEMRKRIFWTIRKMDVYTGALLGLPPSLSDEDIDQDHPLEVDDEYISDHKIESMPPGSVSMMTAFNVSIKLMDILNNIVRVVYPISTPDGLALTKSYTIPYSKIRDIEQDLEDWKARLPPAFDPVNDSPEMVRAQQALRLAYAFNQVLLYRPFLHYVAADKRSTQVDQRAYACAATYLHVCRNLIHLCQKQQSVGLLNGSVWFNMYTTFFAILSLVYFAAENPDNPTTHELMKDALQGKAILLSIAKQNLSADRCSSTLEVIFARLPVWMREGKPNPMPKRKRKQAGERSQPTASGSRPNSRPASMINPSLQSLKTDQATPNSMPTSAAVERPFTPQSAGFSSGQYTPTDYSPATRTLAQFGLQPHEQDVNDLSSMIFSSSEPFSYPNQPLATLEDTAHLGFYGQAQSLGEASMNSQNQPNGDQLEAQLYSLPPFNLGANSWPPDNLGSTQGAEPGSAETYMQQQQQQQGMTSGPMKWQQQQNAMLQGQGQGYNEASFNDLFGAAEWTGPLTGQGFEHY